MAQFEFSAVYNPLTIFILTALPTKPQLVAVRDETDYERKKRIVEISRLGNLRIEHFINI